MEQNYLAHHGVKGMKWGVRRRSKKQAAFDNAHDHYKRAHDKKSVSQMSDQELRERNNRLQAERQYAALTKKKTITGKDLVKAYVATAGTITGIIAATGTYKKVADKILEKVGTTFVKDIVIDSVH